MPVFLSSHLETMQRLLFSSASPPPEPNLAIVRVIKHVEQYYSFTTIYITLPTGAVLSFSPVYPITSFHSAMPMGSLGVNLQTTHFHCNQTRDTRLEICCLIPQTMAMLMKIHRG